LHTLIFYIEKNANLQITKFFGDIQKLKSTLLPIAEVRSGFWMKKRTWFTGADGVVVCWPTVGVVPTEAGADWQTLPLELVAVFSFRAVRVGSAI
jgi:hypothetical protein